MVSRINLLLIGLLILMVSVWFVFKDSSTKPILNQETGFVYSPAKHIGDFNLIDLNETEIDQSRFAGKWWLVYFGFTYCPDACPVALGDMKNIKKALDETGKQNTGFVFISVDPDRDTAERLKQYIDYFDPQFYAATGEPDELEKFATNMGVAFVVPDNVVDQDYLVGHSSALLLLNPNTELAAVFNVPHKPAVIAQGIMKLQQ